MQNAESRMQKLRLFLPFAFCILHSSFALANDVSVDRRAVFAGDTLTITLTLENAFAGADDDVDLPLQNLELVGPPSVDTRFEWSNLTGSVRKRELRYTARALEPGEAVIGPILLHGDGGQQETLAAIRIQVNELRTITSTDSSFILRELLATGREPFFLLAEADKTSVFEGEQLVVKWTLYNAATVSDWRIGAIPKLPEFWSEELPYRDSEPSPVIVNGVSMRELAVRGVALYPLRSGTHTIGGMTIDAQVMHGRRRGIFNQFEGEIREASYTSAPLRIDVKPLPAGPPVDVVGDLELTCGEPSQQPSGPLVIDVTLAGAGNLRSAAAPHLDGELEGRLQIEQGKVAVVMESRAVRMTRSWRYLIFPRQRGMMPIPAIVTDSFSPASGARRELRCVERAIFVNDAVSLDVAATPAQPETRRAWWPVAIGIAGAVVAVAISLLLWRRHRRVRREARELIAGRSMTELREAVDARVVERGLDPKVLVTEPTDRGDAYRAVRSLADGVERERFHVEPAEVERRVRELLATIGR
jgi:hypothetical protein